MKETLRGVTSLGTELRQEQSFCREGGRSELIVEARKEGRVKACETETETLEQAREGGRQTGRQRVRERFC
jgi:hypothetical protein